MTKKYIVYKAKFDDDMVYIGITGNSLKRRIKQHLSNSSKSFFSNALKTDKKVKWEVVESNLDKDSAIFYEKYYISLYNSNNKKNGYNLTSGGECTEFNAIARRKFSKAHGGIYFRVFSRLDFKLLWVGVNQTDCRKKLNIKHKCLKSYINGELLHKDYIFLTVGSRKYPQDAKKYTKKKKYNTTPSFYCYFKNKLIGKFTSLWECENKINLCKKLIHKGLKHSKCFKGYRFNYA